MFKGSDDKPTTNEQNNEEVVESVENDNEAINNEALKNIEKQLTEMQDKEKKLLYLLAEKENQINLLRQDIIVEKESFSIKFIKTISKELDDLFRIMNILVEENPDNSTIQALKANSEKFIKAMEKMNVRVILPQKGDDFDSSMHNAIAQVKDESLENGKIAQVASACYIMGEKVISHAMVIVVNN